MSTKKEKEFKELDKNTGFLHKSVSKSTDSAPDFFGNINIDGTTFDLAGWRKQVEGADGKTFISLNLDKSSLSIDDKTKAREANIKAFKAAKKKKDAKDTFVYIEGTGSLHTSKKEAQEDFFGTVLINGEKKYLKAYASKTQKGASVLRLEVTDGARTKEERAEIATDFI